MDIDFSTNCKECIYYDKETNLCFGFTYWCECLKAFCPMYEKESKREDI